MQLDTVYLLMPAFMACIVLTAIHGYLGLHVVRRGVIFVDLALAQVAALGSVFGMFLGLMPDTLAGYLSSLSFTLVGALFLALIRKSRVRIYHEAVVGIVYVVSAATSIIVLSQLPDAAEELESFLVGHLLFVSWEDLLFVCPLYAFVGLVHVIFRRQFWLATEGYSIEEISHAQSALWDFLFYATFGLVVTSSVKLAGILLVFCFLVIPSVCSLMLISDAQSSSPMRLRVAFAWIIGAIGSFLGLILSWTLDWPTGAAVVCSFGALFFICLIYQGVVGKPAIQCMSDDMP